MALCSSLRSARSRRRPSAPSLAHSLTHAWVQTGQPWMDDGLAEFLSPLWIERGEGRDAAVAQLDALMQPVATADTLSHAAASANPADGASSSSTRAVVGQPLIAAYDELFFRRKPQPSGGCCATSPASSLFNSH